MPNVIMADAPPSPSGLSREAPLQLTAPCSPFCKHANTHTKMTLFGKAFQLTSVSQLRTAVFYLCFYPCWHSTQRNTCFLLLLLGFGHAIWSPLERHLEFLGTLRVSIWGSRLSFSVFIHQRRVDRRCDKRALLPAEHVSTAPPKCVFSRSLDRSVDARP